MYEQFHNSEPEHDGWHNMRKRAHLYTHNLIENFCAYSSVIVVQY
jgi:hypothetical protein